MENPTNSFRKTNLCFSSYENPKLKVKLWWVGARERKKRAFWVPFILSEEIFFNICVLSQCIVYWIHFQNIHTFTYQKTLLHTLLLLVFKIVESLQCTLDIWSEFWWRSLIHLRIAFLGFFSEVISRYSTVQYRIQYSRVNLLNNNNHNNDNN